MLERDLVQAELDRLIAQLDGEPRLSADAAAEILRPIVRDALQFRALQGSGVLFTGPAPAPQYGATAP